MEKLLDRILKIREEVKFLARSENAIKRERLKKQLILEELEKLTANQLDLFEN